MECDVDLTLTELLGIDLLTEKTGSMAIEEEIMKSVNSQSGNALGRSTVDLRIGTDDFFCTSTDFGRSNKTGKAVTQSIGTLTPKTSHTYSLQRRVKRQLAFTSTTSVEIIQGKSDFQELEIL